MQRRPLDGARRLALISVSIWMAACAAGGGSSVNGDADDITAIDAGANQAVDSGSTPSAPQMRDAGDMRLPRDPNDRDGDGARGGVDCDDDDRTIYPGAPELCDGKDNDCDGFVDTFPIDGSTFYPDGDRDGLGNGASPVRSCEAPAGWVTNGDDCDDTNELIRREGEFCLMTERPVVYVALSGHDDNAGDGPMRAVRTIAKGIQRALACPDQACSVLIAEGRYQEAVTVADGVSLFGGYSADFTKRDRTRHEVVITANVERVVSAEGLHSETKLEGLTVLGATLDGDQGRSSYAVFVRDSADALHLHALTVRAGQGERGKPGSRGEPQSCNARGGLGGAAFQCGASSGISGDASGDPIRGGAGGQGGRSECKNVCPLLGSSGISDGKPGQAGMPGENAPGGLSAKDTAGAFVDGAWLATSSQAGRRGAHGTGGGGGGAGGTKRFNACFGCNRDLIGGHGGDGAPGGCGGGGGAAGKAGGGAFALVVIDSAVTLADVTLLGGVGGLGGAGGAGIAGTPGGQVTTLNLGEKSSKKCGLFRRYRSGSGSLGGTGGAGGAGGGGAGGLGGAAITLALAGKASLVEAGPLSLTVGTAGVGGAGGAGAGAAGQRGALGAAVARQQF